MDRSWRLVEVMKQQVFLITDKVGC